MAKIILRLSKLRVLKIFALNFSTKSLDEIMNTRPRLALKRRTHNAGLFGIPELKNMNGFAVIKDQCIFDTRRLLAEATNKERDRKLVDIFDDVSNTLCKVADLAEFIRVAHPSVYYNYAAEQANSEVMEMMEELNKSRHLYDLLKSVVVSGDYQPMSEEELYIARQFLLEFEQSGANLDEEERNKLRRVNDAILKLGHMFITEATKPRELGNTSALGLLDVWYEKFEGAVTDFDEDSPYSSIREQKYKALLRPDKRQEKILTGLLRYRNEYAKLTEHPTYAHKMLKENIFNTPKLVLEFLILLSLKIRKYADQNYETMRLLKQQEYFHDVNLEEWDVPYYKLKAERELLHLKSYEYTPYFSLGACIEGISYLYSNLFGISFKYDEMKPGEGWSHDIYKLVVHHENEGILGYIYFDLFKRLGKPDTDCHSIIRTGKQLRNGDYQFPVVVIMMNLPNPKNGPALLTYPMLRKLFYRVGVAVQPILKKTNLQYVAATSCSIADVNDTFGKLMEYFCSDPKVLKTFAKHHETKEPIPEELLKKICLSRCLFTACSLQKKVFMSIVDQIYHGAHPLKFSTTELLKIIQKEHYSLPYVEETAAQLRFTELVKNGAQYYVGILSDGLAACIWQRFFGDDVFSRKSGEHYRFACLGELGTRPAKVVFAEFLKEEVTPMLMAESLSRQIAFDANLVLPYIIRELNVKIEV